MNAPTRRFPAWPRWDRLGGLRAMRADLSRFVGSALYGTRGWSPDLDLAEGAEGWTVRARLPGVAPEEVTVEVQDRELRISGRSTAEVAIDGAQVERRAFNYRVTIPGEVDAERVGATMDHGLLTVQLPRSTRPQRRTVTVARRGAALTVEEAAPAAGVAGPDLQIETGQAGST